MKMKTTVINPEVKVLQKTTILGKEITVYGTLENPLFLAKDVAEWIEYSKDGKGNYNVSAMINTVDEDEKQKIFTNLNNNKVGSNTWFLTEDGLYEIFFQSRKPIAKQFKKAVKKILKELRRKGGYIVTTQNDTPEMIMARALQVAQETINKHNQQMQMLEGRNEFLKQQNQVLTPKAEYFDKTLSSEDTMRISQIASELGISGIALNKKLHQLGVQHKVNGQWILYNKYEGKDYTKTHTYTEIINGESRTFVSTVWTQKGRKFIHDLFKELNVA